MEPGVDRRIDALSAVMWTLYLTVAVKREPEGKALISVFQPSPALGSYQKTETVDTSS